METNEKEIVDLKQIIGAMIFGANRSLSIKEMQRTLRGVGEEAEGPAHVYANIKEAEIAQALERLIVELDQLQAGIHIAEVAGGFRYQSDPQCGLWLRHLLDKGKPSRLSQPGLETLAVIAYRQPITKGQVEGIRGVSIDHVLRKLLEMQLIRIAGRSELPGRPFMYATTHFFLEHFGLKDLAQLEQVNPMLKRRDAAVSVATAQEEARPVNELALAEEADEPIEVSESEADESPQAESDPEVDPDLSDAPDDSPAEDEAEDEADEDDDDGEYDDDDEDEDYDDEKVP
ncbi:MAG: SMC-Scp complex subunit ScpB [Lentisphaerae bacterium]|nr:SMC-Scp complex subunit ScpB [Lentisphaerota bacterium]